MEYANDDLLRDIMLTSDDILERVDEYSLYCHYLGYEPIPHTGKYRSPIRSGAQTDDVPSFGIFYSTTSHDREFLWKDQATGQVGDIFRLVQLMHGYTSRREAEKRVIMDFSLGYQKTEAREKIITHEAPERTEMDIRTVDRDFTVNEVAYWRALNIQRDLLSEYKTTAVKYFWLAAEQSVPYAPKEFAFSYRIGSKYQIYQPFETKDRKFRNNLTDAHIFGLQQLKFQSPLLVITKSMKDVMHFASFGYEAISPRSENTPIAEKYLRALEQKYRHIVTFFDNDGKCRRDFYPYIHHEVPLSMGAKDPTDVAKLHGIDASRDMLKDILRRYL